MVNAHLLYTLDKKVRGSILVSSRAMRKSSNILHAILGLSQPDVANLAYLAVAYDVMMTSF